MDSAVNLFLFRLLVVVMCVVAAWRGAQQPPTRDVVELVSVVYKPARVQAQPQAQAQVAVEPVNVLPAAPVLAQAKAAQVAPSKPLLQRRTAPPVRHAKTVRPQIVKVSCRPPACPAAAPGAKAIIKRTGARQARKAEPPLPAVFVPIRNLGLYLQARLGLQDAKAAPKKKRKR